MVNRHPASILRRWNNLFLPPAVARVADHQHTGSLKEHVLTLARQSGERNKTLRQFQREKSKQSRIIHSGLLSGAASKNNERADESLE